MSLFPVLVFFGCSTTTVIRQGQELFLKEPGVLITKGGKSLKIHHTLIRDDSIIAIDSRLGQRTQMPVIESQKLVFKKRGRGAWQGMLIFAGVCAVLGAIPDPDCGDPCLFPNGGLAGSLFWAILAAPVGAVWGAVLGSPHYYVFEQPVPVADSAGYTESKTESKTENKTEGKTEGKTGL